MKLPVYNIVLGDADGIQKMSLVDMPAVESDFLAFAKENQQLLFSADEEQHIVLGCALRADYPIYRYNECLGEYYVVFTKETIKQLYEKFMIEGRVGDVNLNHDQDTQGAHLIQSFIKDTDKGINPKGFEDVKDGSWFCAYKIQDDALWRQIKDGKYNGFSVEGYFDLSEQFHKEQTLDEIIDELLENK